MIERPIVPRIRKGTDNYSPHYVRGNKSVSRVSELRLSDGTVIDRREGDGWPIATCERVAHEHGSPWAESETISGFYSWCMGLAENYEPRSNARRTIRTTHVFP